MAPTIPTRWAASTTWRPACTRWAGRRRRYRSTSRALERKQAVLGPDHPDTLHILHNLASCSWDTAQTPSEQRRAAARLVKVIRGHLHSPLRYLTWLGALPNLAGYLAAAIDAGLLRHWLPLFDRLSQAMADTAEIQVDQLINQAYQHAADLQATYLMLCLRHGHTAQIPIVLSRIHAPRLVALIWEKLSQTPLDQLNAHEREFIEIRRELAQLRLSAQIITGGRGQPNERHAAISVDAEQEKQQIATTRQQIESLLPRYQALRTQLGERIRPLLNPGHVTPATLRAGLKTGQALVLLVDLPSHRMQPFGLLLRFDSNTLHSLPELPHLPALTELLACGHTIRGQRNGYRRGSAGVRLQTEPQVTTLDTYHLQENIRKNLQELEYFQNLLATLFDETALQ